MIEEKTQTHFGYQSVAVEQKQTKVNQVFDNVAQRYDLMNDLMSFGIHHFWKWFTIYLSALRPHQRILDLASGSGDLSRKICEKLYPQIELVIADINLEMLNLGRNRLIDQGFFQGLYFVLANAECLPFPDRYFDVTFMAFGLRNVTHQQQTLQELYRLTKPGGKVYILEFSRPRFEVLQRIYDWYSFHIIPKLGAIFANDSSSYQYLVESIRMHPSQNELKQMILTAGFDHCEYINLSGGIVALHKAYRY